MRRKRSWPLFVVVAAAIMCMLIAGGIFLLASNRSQPSLPRVFVVDPEAGDELVAGVPALVYGRVEDPDGISSVELWINGHVAATQLNPEGGTISRVAQSWRPREAGAYTLVLRATDARGYSGQSATILINVVDKTPPPAGSVSEIPAGEAGEASGLVPVADDSAPPVGASDDGSHPEAGISDEAIPTPDFAMRADQFRPLVGIVCSVAPGLCDDSGADAAPRLDPEICLFLTGTTDCMAPSRPGLAPPIAPRISARYAEACSIEVTWSDESDDEIGFRLYRTADGIHDDLVAQTGAGGTIHTDHPRAAGDYRYHVAAFNSQGESPSAPSLPVTVPAEDCVGAAGEVTYLDLEALTFSVDEPLDRVYCYYSVGGAPFVRVPGDEAEFLEPTDAGWNIADHAAGAQRLSIPHDRGQPLAVGAQCLGWQGGALLDLGGFQQEHPAEEWDGRTLSNAEGGFRVTYRIQPATLERREGEPSAIIDPSLPAPHNLRFGRLDWCRGGGTDPVTCALEDQAMLHWDWALPPGDTRTPWGYEVSYRLPASFGRIGDATLTRRYYYTLDKRAPGVFTQPCIINTANPLEPLDLGPERIPDTDFFGAVPLGEALEGFVFADDVYYSVQALVVTPDGAVLESPPSEEHWVGMTGCTSVLALQLTKLRYDVTPDPADPFRVGEPTCEYAHANAPDDPADIYGWVEVALDSYEDRIPGFRFWWNCPYCDDPGRVAGTGPTGTRPPHDTRIGCEGGELSWADLALNVEGPDGGGTGYSRANNTILIPVGARPTHLGLRVRYAFYDYDSELRTGDDLWCAADEVITVSHGLPESPGAQRFEVQTYPGTYLTDYDIGCSVGMTVYSLPVSR